MRPGSSLRAPTIDKSHEMARGEPFKKGVLSRCIGRTKGGLNSKLHVVCNEAGKPLVMMLTEGQMSDHKGARLMFHTLPNARTLIADKGYDSDDFRAKRSKRVEQNPAFRHGAIAKRRSTTIRRSTASATKSRTSSRNSRTGGDAPPATTVARTPSSRPSASPQPSPSSSINES
jgi:transposase